MCHVTKIIFFLLSVELIKRYVHYNWLTCKKKEIILGGILIRDDELFKWGEGLKGDPD